MNYNHKKIEAKWQKIWRAKKTHEPNLKAPKKPFFNLMMFPYPSAEGLHVGNMYAFTGADIYGRKKRMEGFSVFEPMGLDGFGIHSENYALKIGAHPIAQAKVSQKRFYKQLESIGNSYAWNEKLETYDIGYYRWTQWIFIELFKRGLAYRKKQAVNWCPSCKTVLADEQVSGGKCERCGTVVEKRELEQWFFRITQYAEKLHRNIGKLDWSEKVKIAQRNWIGRSEGALVNFQLTTNNSQRKNTIEIFTTRPDTIFGATYLVLAPEHSFISEVKSQISNWSEVEKYLKVARAKSNEDRIEEGKDKTGVELKGVHAINPGTKKEIPIWISDYVLGTVGTGAIMAVPAHDERDFEFAKKFNLPIQNVIAPHFIEPKNPPHPGKKTVRRKNIHVILENPENKKILMLQWKGAVWGAYPPRTFIIGGVEEGEDPIASAKREIAEETGYSDVRFVRKLPIEVHSEYFAAHKDENRYAEITVLHFEIASEKKNAVSEKETAKHDPVWIDAKEAGNFVSVVDGPFIWSEFLSHGRAYTGEGMLIHSGKFSNTKSEDARWEITKAVGGTRKVQYRLRDWLISRQRYWGPPIPMIFCEICAKAHRGERSDMSGWYTVPEKDLPVKLPFVKDFRPQGTGKSPLASVESFYKVRCPKCKSSARRETDVSDTFLDSAWYFFRYLDVKNTKRAFDSARMKEWLPVHLYTGGAEHSVLHLLYTRFMTQVFKDMKLINFEEPFVKFRAQGLIIKDGAKMSKSKGNVINPDEYIKKFGADALRTYLMFLGPFEQGGDFQDRGILGITRFFERVWRLGSKKFNKGKESEELQRAVHKTIKKVSEDIERLSYNTAVSALMILLNEIEKSDFVSRGSFESFIKLLNPFAPHLSHELWAILGNKGVLDIEKWPTYNAKLAEDAMIELVIQVNGKLRGKILVPRDISERDAIEAAKVDTDTAPYLKDGYKKVIFVPGRLINFVL